MCWFVSVSQFILNALSLTQTFTAKLSQCVLANVMLIEGHKLFTRVFRVAHFNWRTCVFFSGERGEDGFVNVKVKSSIKRHFFGSFH